MENTTDNTEPAGNEPMSQEQAVDWLLSPEQSKETETETAEAPGEPTDAEDVEAESDAPDEVEEYEDDLSDQEDGDDATEDPGDDLEEQPDTQAYHVKVDGKEVEVTLDELKRGYSGQAYIQKGMEQNKEVERTLRTAAEAMQQERNALLQMYERAQTTGFKSAPQEPNADTLKSDPIAYMEAEAKYRQDMKEYQAEQAQMTATYQRQQQQMQAAQQHALQQQFQKLVEMAPEFGDPEKSSKIRDRLVQDAQAEYGFDAKDLESVADARVVVALRDALEYRKLQKGREAARKGKEPAKAVTKPSGKRRDGGKRARAEKALQQAMKTQSPDDWVNVLLS